MAGRRRSSAHQGTRRLPALGLAFRKGRGADAVELGQEATELGLKDYVAKACGWSGGLEMLLECDRRVFLWILCTRIFISHIGRTLPLVCSSAPPSPSLLSFFRVEVEGGEKGRWLGLRLRSGDLCT